MLYGGKPYTAVDSANFCVYKGEIVGIVGESGCGKSLTALAIDNLLPFGVERSGGQVVFDGKELTSLSAKEKRKIYGKDIAMIFQEPMTSLNPLMKIGRQVDETLRIHTAIDKQERDRMVRQVLIDVGLQNVDRLVDAYPHELSGGMRQRVMIASAIISKPSLLIADEPTTALDVFTQAQVLDVLKKIHADTGMSILFISHDLDVIKQICSRVIVMYAGHIVESGNIQDVLSYPCHEYTKGLLRSIPSRDKKGLLLECIRGKVPSVTQKKDGCPFAPRCASAQNVCFTQRPGNTPGTGENHVFACHFGATGEGVHE